MSLIDSSAELGVTILDDGEATEDQQQKRLMGNFKHTYMRDNWQSNDIRGYLAKLNKSVEWRIKQLIT